MKKRFASVAFFLSPLALLLFSNEILSLLALLIMSLMCIGGIIVAREAM